MELKKWWKRGPEINTIEIYFDLDMNPSISFIALQDREFHKIYIC